MPNTYFKSRIPHTELSFLLHAAVINYTEELFMADRVTIQDIADALGVSRNTVSKAINNTGILAESTKEKVLQKAVEMGYKQFSYIDVPSMNLNKPAHLQQDGSAACEIALFTTTFLGGSHFASTMLDKLHKEIAQLGYSLTMHHVTPEEIENLRLPISFNKERTAAVLGIEMFDYNYDKMLCELETPTLFVDTPVSADEPLKSDLLLMNNRDGIYSFVGEMLRRGKKRIGFIGEYLHCRSFFERYMSFRDAMYLMKLPIIEEYCITGNKEGAKTPGYDIYREYLYESFQKLDELPDVFICANDFVAIDALQAFKRLGISVPNDVWLCGFDDSPESKVTTPSLTSIHIHSQIMGVCATQLLLSRIKEPSLNYRTVYTETNLVYRESTED